MLPLLAASFVFAFQGASKSQEASILPKAAPATLPNDVRDWDGFKYLPTGSRGVPSAFPNAGDWSAVKGTPTRGAATWRTKVVILDRVDRTHERGSGLVWPGHHSVGPTDLARAKRALPQLRALVADASGGAVDIVFDVTEETEPQSIQGGDFAGFAARYLNPRINGGSYQAEDGVFRGPYQSVFVIHPVGGEASEPFEVQNTPVSAIGLSDIVGQEADGVLAGALFAAWQRQVALRARDAGLRETNGAASVGNAAEDWKAILAGRDVATEDRLRLVAKAVARQAPLARSFALGQRGPDTTVRLAKDPARGTVLVSEELGAFRAGGFALPTPAGGTLDASATPTLSFWMKSEAADPIVLQFGTEGGGKSVAIGRDVAFAYDGAWHQVKVDLRPFGRISQILVAPDANARARIKETLGPIVASFDDFEATADAPDSKPISEPPSPTGFTAEARAAWAATAGPGDARRALLKDPSEAVRANASAAALVRPDPADTSALIDTAMYNYEPAVFAPALQALGNEKTAAAIEGLQRALRTAASDRARGVAAEVLAQSGDPKFVPYFLALNQSRSRASRVSAIHALAHLPGGDAAMMRMAFLPQNDPEIKMEATLTADANDDYQGRKLLWSAVNEPSDAVRLESLRRLSYSTVAEFAEAGMRGVRDDSVGVRVGLLDAWSADMRPTFAPSIKLALTDAAPRVRAAALRALGASTESLTGTDIAAAFEDADPRVQLAVLEVATKKKIDVPAAARERFRKSPDPAVRAAAG